MTLMEYLLRSRKLWGVRLTPEVHRLHHDLRLRLMHRCLLHEVLRLLFGILPLLYTGRLLVKRLLSLITRPLLEEITLAQRASHF